MKFISFYDEQLFVNTELIYEISVEETDGPATYLYYLEVLFEDKHNGGKRYDVFVSTDIWANFEKYLKNFWEDMNNNKIVNVVPRL